MSTLPVPAFVGRAEAASLVPRRPQHIGPPGNARGRGSGVSGSERSLFVIDGPSVAETDGPPVVVIAVNVVGPTNANLGFDSRSTGSPVSRVLRLPVIGDPYAQFDEPERGKLVDEYL